MFRLSNERHRDGARVAVKAAKAYGAKGKDMEAQYASLGEGLGLGFYGSWVIKCPHFSHHPTIRY